MLISGNIAIILKPKTNFKIGPIVKDRPSHNQKQQPVGCLMKSKRTGD
jgi:hypothetical protein